MCCALVFFSVSDVYYLKMIYELGKVAFGFYNILFQKVYKSSFWGLNIIEIHILIFFCTFAPWVCDTS